MKQSELDTLEPGDIIRHVNGTHGFVVLDNRGKGSVTAGRIVEVTNPDEWLLVQDHRAMRAALAEITRLEEGPDRMHSGVGRGAAAIDRLHQAVQIARRARGEYARTGGHSDDCPSLRGKKCRYPCYMQATDNTQTNPPRRDGGGNATSRKSPLAKQGPGGRGSRAPSKGRR